MFWNKKEDKNRLPDLPPIDYNYPADEDDYEEGNYEKQKLPSFPDSPIQKGFTQTVIKDAINDEEKIDYSDDKYKTFEIDDYKKPLPSLPSLPERPTKESASLTSEAICG